MKEGQQRLPLSVVIPTFGRDEVLTDTIEQLLAQSPAAAELLIVDQTPRHPEATEAKLLAWHATGAIRWIRRTEASQPSALNAALMVATQPFVLMLDDDIRIEPGFLASHIEGFLDESVWGVVGQVLQPGEVPLEAHVRKPDEGPLADLEFPFRSATATWVLNGMSGNLCVRTDRAREIGGFDENFLPPVAYRFDTEFCKRLCKAGGRIRFQPSARIYHLRAARGGTRSQGSHQNSADPIHGVGDYYFAFRLGLNLATLSYVLRRPLREVTTRYHLRRPWWIPVKLIGELRAMLLAFRLFRSGPRLLAGASGKAQSGALH
jgi:GT2 family glycosyltransferase